MSENPYAPPRSDLGREPLGVAGAGGDFDIGQCLSDGWSRTWANFPLWLGVGVVGVLAAALATVTVIGIILVLPVLLWGSVLFGLRMYDGAAAFGDLFEGFSDYGKALSSMVVVGGFTIFIGFASQSVQLVGEALGQDLVYWVGLVIYLAITFLVAPRLLMAFFYAVDQGLPPVESIRQCWQDTGPVWGKVVLTNLLTYVVYLIGALALLIGMIPATVIVYLMWVSAYRQLTGQAAS